MISHRRNLLQRILLISLTLLLLFLIYAPILWLFISSISTRAELLAVPPHWIPTQVTFANYANILFGGPDAPPAAREFLYAMGNSGMAYSRFGRTDRRGVPIWALLATAIVALAIFLLQMVSDGAYEYIVAASGLTGFIAWLGIAISHYRFRRAYLAQGKSLQDLVYRAKWFPFGPLLALALCILVVIGQDTQWLLHGQFDWQRMVITYMGLPVFVGFYVYHKRRHRTRKIPLDQVNLSRDVD